MEQRIWKIEKSDNYCGLNFEIRGKKAESCKTEERDPWLGDMTTNALS